MSNDNFIYYILLPKLGAKFGMGKDEITYKQASLKLYENGFPTLQRNYTLLCQIAVTRTVQYKNLIRRMEKIGCVALKRKYISKGSTKPLY